MKNHILTLLFFLIVNIAYTQNFTICNTLSNDIFQYISNPIKITVENTDNKNIYISTNIGKLSNENDNYIFTTNELGVVIFTVYKIINKDTTKLGAAEFKVKEFPKPTLSILNQTGGEINKSKLVAARTLDLTLKSKYYGSLNPPYVIEEYSVCIIKSNGTTQRADTIQENKLTIEVKDLLKQTEPNDIILFYNIKYSITGTEKKNLILEQPLLLKIKN